MTTSNKKNTYRYVPTLEALRADIGELYQKIQTGETSVENTTLLGELALVTGLIQSMVSQGYNPEEELMMNSRVANILDAIRTKSAILQEERKYALNLEKMRLLKLTRQGFTLEEFTDAITFLFKVSSQFIPPEKLEEYSNTINQLMQEKSMSLSQKK